MPAAVFNQPVPAVACFLRRFEIPVKQHARAQPVNQRRRIHRHTIDKMPMVALLKSENERMIRRTRPRGNFQAEKSRIVGRQTMSAQKPAGKRVFATDPLNGGRPRNFIHVGNQHQSSGRH